jgi:PASTA domain
MGYPDRGGARFAAFRARCAALIATALVVSGLTAGSASQSAAASAAARAGAPPYRFLYDSDSAPATVASYGWNLIDVGSRWSADQLQRGAKGLVWVGDYDNSSCAWEVSNPTLTKEVRAAVRDAKVFGYFISDEPNPYACPNAPAQHKARSDLIHSIAPAKPTVIVLDSNGFKGLFTRDALDQLPLWKGTADYIGLDPYPCRHGSGCHFSWIDKTIQAANAAGLNYWGVVQAFNDSSWRWPTADELSHMLNQWGASKQTGYMTFAWTWSGNNLSSKSALLAIFRRFNTGAAPRRCVVPKVLGLTLARARVAIARANCLDGKVSTRYSTRRRGHVIEQYPRPGRRLANGGRVSFVISKGRQR